MKWRQSFCSFHLHSHGRQPVISNERSKKTALISSWCPNTREEGKRRDLQPPWPQFEAAGPFSPLRKASLSFSRVHGISIPKPRRRKRGRSREEEEVDRCEQRKSIILARTRELGRKSRRKFDHLGGHKRAADLERA